MFGERISHYGEISPLSRSVCVCVCMCAYVCVSDLIVEANLLVKTAMTSASAQLSI